MRRSLAPICLGLLLASGASAITTDACDEGNPLPLAFRMLDLGKAQKRYIHWVKVWRYAADVEGAGKKLPGAASMKELASDLRKIHNELDDCAQQLLRETDSAEEKTKKNVAKTAASLEKSRGALAKLESALKVTEFKLDKRIK
jgi:hypothetical protein